MAAAANAVSERLKPIDLGLCEQMRQKSLEMKAKEEKSTEGAFNPYKSIITSTSKQLAIDSLFPCVLIA